MKFNEVMTQIKIDILNDMFSHDISADEQITLNDIEMKTGNKIIDEDMYFILQASDALENIEECLNDIGYSGSPYDAIRMRMERMLNGEEL